MMDNISLPIPLPGEHWNATVVSLNAFTDDIDTPVHTSEYHMFRSMIAEKMEGNIFFLENYHSGNAYVILVDCPDFERAVLDVRENIATILSSTSKITIVPCKVGECEKVCRRTYRAGMAKKPLVTMSNTWGDSNGRSCICEEFVLKEIDAAANLGVDIVQIDDGWQVGDPYDPKIRDANNRRIFADDFWTLDTNRFPNGMKYITEYAAKKGVSMGLWFAPECRDHFACMQRDIAFLRNAYENWGFRFFKLDMYWIDDGDDRDRFLEFLGAIFAFGDDVSVQLDVTRNGRINYLCGKQYGTVFVENRYTRTTTFYPHRTLKNLWLLSRYIPASRFQFELVNPQHFADAYDPADEFATPHYDVDYLFASVMLSNPLFWLEMQHLSPESTKKLQDILEIWKNYRNIFSESDVSPIGSKPTGRSFTGFHIQHNTQAYALIFREVTEAASGTYKLPQEYQSAAVLSANGSVTATIVGNTLHSAFSKTRSYALLKLNK